MRTNYWGRKISETLKTIDQSMRSHFKRFTDQLSKICAIWKSWFWDTVSKNYLAKHLLIESQQKKDKKTLKKDMKYVQS